MRLSSGYRRTVTGYLCSERVQLVACDFGATAPSSKITGRDRPSRRTAFQDRPPLPADVIACEPCTVLSFNLDAHVEAKPCCMVHVDRIRANLALISMKMSSDLLDRLSIASMRSTRDKVLAYLTNEAKAQGSAVFDIPLQPPGTRRRALRRAQRAFARTRQAAEGGLNLVLAQPFRAASPDRDASVRSSPPTASEEERVLLVGEFVSVELLEERKRLGLQIDVGHVLRYTV